MAEPVLAQKNGGCFNITEPTQSDNGIVSNEYSVSYNNYRSEYIIYGAYRIYNVSIDNNEGETGYKVGSVGGFAYSGGYTSIKSNAQVENFNILSKQNTTIDSISNIVWGYALEVKLIQTNKNMLEPNVKFLNSELVSVEEFTFNKDDARFSSYSNNQTLEIVSKGAKQLNVKFELPESDDSAFEYTNINNGAYANVTNLTGSTSIQVSAGSALSFDVSNLLAKYNGNTIEFKVSYSYSNNGISSYGETVLDKTSTTNPSNTVYGTIINGGPWQSFVGNYAFSEYLNLNSNIHSNLSDYTSLLITVSCSLLEEYNYTLQFEQRDENNNSINRDENNNFIEFVELEENYLYGGKIENLPTFEALKITGYIYAGTQLYISKTVDSETKYDYSGEINSNYSQTLTVKPGSQGGDAELLLTKMVNL